jgi:hypothetical protein
MLSFAKNLKRIGEIYYSGTNTGEQEIQDKIRRCLDLSVDMRNELVNAKLRLDDVGFDDEIEILDSYIRILGKDLDMQEAELHRIADDVEIAPRAPDRPLDNHLENLFREITLEMQEKGEGAIAIAGFTMHKDRQPELITLLNEMSLLELSKLTQFQIFERTRVHQVLKEQKLVLDDLIDTSKAISVGKMLAAQYILTGMLIEMPNSLIIFARVVNVETAEVESAAQVIVPKSQEVRALLKNP